MALDAEIQSQQALLAEAKAELERATEGTGGHAAQAPVPAELLELQAEVTRLSKQIRDEVAQHHHVRLGPDRAAGDLVDVEQERKAEAQGCTAGIDGEDDVDTRALVAVSLLLALELKQSMAKELPTRWLSISMRVNRGVGARG